MTSKDFYLTGFCAFMLISTILIARLGDQNRNTLERIETHYLNKVDSLIQNDIEREEMYDRWRENNNIQYIDFLK